MLASLILLVFFLLATLFYLRWMTVKSYWEKQGVPFIPPHPIWGSLTFLLRENPNVWVRRVYEKYKSPYVGIWLLHRPALIINSPEIARRVLIKDAFNFRDRFLSSGASDPMGALNLFTVNDPIWSEVRRRLTSVFTSSKLKSIQPIMTAKTRDLISRILREKSENLSLRFLFSDLTTDVISEAAFGVAGEATLTGISPMREITLQFQTFDLYRGICWGSIFFCPSVVDTFGFTFYPKSATRYFKLIFEHIAKQRKETLQHITEPRNILDALLKMKQDNDSGKGEFSDDLIVSQAAIFLNAGFDTSAVALTFTIYELAYDHNIQERLYQELLEAKEECGKDEIDPQILAELPYLNACIKETERKYPPFGYLDRLTANDYKIDDNLTIKAGTPIYVNAGGMHYDPQYFPEPNKYYPDRFMPENEKLLTPYTYMPFGEGPRNCIGKRFALQNIQIALAGVIVNFHVRPLSGSEGPKPNDVVMDKRALFLGPNDHMYVDFVPRKT